MNFLGLIVRYIDWFFTIGATSFLLIAYLTPFVSPESMWQFSLLAIAFPLLIVLVLIAFLSNLMRFNKLTIYPLAVLLLGISYISCQYNFAFLKDYENTKSKINKGTTLVSYNVRYFYNEEWGNNLDSVVGVVKQNNADIVAFQEFSTQKNSPLDVAGHFNSLKNHFVSHYLDTKGNVSTSGLAIYTHHTIVSKGEHIFASGFSGVQWADLLIGHDTVRLFNIHLQSNGLGTDDHRMINALVTDSLSLDKNEGSQMRKLLSKYKENAIKRSSQADSIALLLEQSPYPTILCGDFNDVPLSYAFSKIKADMGDSFAAKGSGYAYSYNKLFKLLKIDYILYDKKRFEVLEYHSPDVPFSDHNPVVSTFLLKEAPKI